MHDSATGKLVLVSSDQIQGDCYCQHCYKPKGQKTKACGLRCGANSADLSREG